MSAQEQKLGRISWVDLTVDKADELRDFYGSVAGWEPMPVAMGDYNDYAMGPADSDPVAGICHARGVNADLPPQWIIYITVADLDHSMKQCRDLGGEVIFGPKEMAGMGQYCVIKDPAGAVAALFESKE